MKKIFKKAMAVFGGLALVGATISGAFAASYPQPFDSSSVIVIGRKGSDGDAASKLSAALSASLGIQRAPSSSSSATLVGGSSITEEEVILGQSIVQGNIPATIVSGTGKSKIPTLKKEKIDWYDGSSSKSYDIEEKILITNMKTITKLDDKNLKEDVALTNQKGLSYRLCIKDLDFSKLGVGNADSLYLDILGKSYEIKNASVSSDYITVVTSEQKSLRVGDSVTVDGKTFKLDAVFSDSVEVNGQIINKGKEKRIDGMKVYVDSIGYQSNAPESSRAILRIGKDIEKTYENGKEYIGQDDKDPLWIWNIDLKSSGESCIGVDYAANIDREKAPVAGDKIKYAGEAYMFPDNFGQVKFEGLSSVAYEDLKISFDKVDLYNNTDTSDVLVSSAPVIVIEGKNTDTITTSGKESDKVYIYYNSTDKIVQTYYRDWDGDYSPSGRIRLANANVKDLSSAGGDFKVASVEIGETKLDVNLTVTAVNGTGDVYLIVARGGNIVLKSKVGGEAINSSAGKGKFEYLGSVKDDYDSDDVITFGGKTIPEKSINYMDYYGIYLAKDSNVERQADDNMLVLSVPEDQVYAKISVTVGGEVQQGGDENLPQESGIAIAWDDETARYSGKNIIVLGGSAANKVAADLLGGEYYGQAFTQATDVRAGEFLIQSYAYGNQQGKIALLVAGYEKEDTEKAVEFLSNKGREIDTTVRKKYKGTSSTMQVVSVQ